MSTRLVVAVDVPTFDRARRIVESLDGLDVLFKVGYEAYYGYGADFLALLQARGASYMLDLKLHDIPNTVRAAVRTVVRSGVKLITVHALGGSEMLATAAEAASERAAELKIDEPAVLAVTILTSIAPGELSELGLQGGPGENVLRLATLAHAARCAGIVCSVGEVAAVKSSFGNTFITLCGGVRPAGSAHGDQKRVASPRDAREVGADYVVVGRPITGDADPAGATRAILDELAAA